MFIKANMQYEMIVMRFISMLADSFTPRVPGYLSRIQKGLTRSKSLRLIFPLSVAFAINFTPGLLLAGDTAPWGHARVTETDYKPQKVVFDVYGEQAKDLEDVLDRASYLSLITGADPFEGSIVLVVHGPALEYFAIKNYRRYRELMDRAHSLTVGETIQIKMCRVAARQRGFQPQDIHGFVEMVPMADAEITRLQNEEGHAYMR